MPPKGKTGSAAGSKKARGPKAHKLPDPFPKGEILKDLTKKCWRLGDVIGQGGFGLIYSASLVDSTGNGTYVIKIEPVSNGPLFCELHVYQRIAKPDMVNEWSKSRKLKYLGVPKFIGSGTHTRGKETFRFMVMERFGSDVQKIFEKAGKKFPRHTVCALALRLIDALEYFHNKGYAHADIKASNLLTGFSHGKELLNQVYLVDFGLAFRFNVDGTCKEYKEDPKRCHDGTVEFTSIDAHKGVAPSPRGDLEILGYCLLQWLCSSLPWENNLVNKDYVRDCKIKYMKDIPGLMKACFSTGSHPDEISKYLTYVSKLNYDDVPDYNKLRSLFRSGISGKDEWKLDLPLSAASTISKKAEKRKSTDITSPVVVEKKSKSAAAKVTKKDKESTPKPKTVKKTAKQVTSPVYTPKAVKSPVYTPKAVKSPAHTPKVVKSPINNPKYVTSPPQTVTPKIPGRPKTAPSRPQTTKQTLAARKRSRSRSPATALAAKKKDADSPKKSTKRRVKRRKAVSTTDASIQTSPGFSSASN